MTTISLPWQILRNDLLQPRQKNLHDTPDLALRNKNPYSKTTNTKYMWVKTFSNKLVSHLEKDIPSKPQGHHPLPYFAITSTEIPVVVAANERAIHNNTLTHREA